MKRLTAALRHDLRLERRYGLYYAAAFLALVWIGILQALPRDALRQALPLLVFVDLGLVGFYFMAGMVLFEKSENTQSALSVSPLQFWEYLASKVLTLTVMAVVVTLCVVVPGVGLAGFRWANLIVGTGLMSAISLLVGYSVVIHYDSITSFLLPSSLYLLVLQLPLVDWVGWIKSPLFYAIPTRASAVVIESAFTNVPPQQLGLAVLYQVAWIAVLACWASDQHMRGVSR